MFFNHHHHRANLFSSQETIRDLEIPEGRRLLREFFHERRVRNQAEFSTLMQCWRLATRGMEVQFLDGRRVNLETNLGRRLGRRVFMEEIVSRYYFGVVQGLVYIGAVAVLIAVAVYLMVVPTLIIPLIAFGFETLALLVFAVVMSYTPSSEGQGGRGESGEQFLISLHSAVMDMNTAVSDLTRLMTQTDVRQEVVISRLVDRQDRLMTQNMKAVMDLLTENTAIMQRLVRTFSGEPEDERRRKDLLEFLNSRPGDDESGPGGLA